MLVFASAPFVDDTDPDILGTIALVDANIVEDNDHPEYNPATTYNAGDIVKVTAQHRLYESLTTNTGQTPSSTLGTHWIDFGATNLWKPFDQLIQSQCVADVDDLLFRFKTNTLVTSIAFFGLGGNAVTVRVWNDPSDVLYDVTKDLVDTSVLVDWFEYYFAETEVRQDVLFDGLPGFTGYTVEVEITSAAAPAKVGEIAIGKKQQIGMTATGGNIELLSFSRADVDPNFGTVSILKRPSARSVEFPLAWPTGDNARIERVLRRIESTPAVFLSDPGDEQYGFFTYGFFQNYRIRAVSRNISFATIEVNSLT